MAEQNPFKVNEHDLVAEWRRMSAMSREFGEAKADADYAVARKKAALAVVRAQTRQAVMGDPARYNLPAKPTVDDAKAAVDTHPDVQAAQKAVDDAEYQQGVAQADVYACVDFRRTLENLVRLLEIDYYADKEVYPKNPAYRTRVSDAERLAERRVEGGN